MTTALSVLDLIPISSGSTAAQALRNSIDLAQRAEAAGYRRYWFAEHHLNPGVAGTSPVVALAATAAQTSMIRLGSGALQMGHRTPLSAVEEFGLLDALYPGRFDLGLGRSGGKPPGSGEQRVSSRVVEGRTENGLLVPPQFSYANLLGSPRIALQRQLLAQPEAQPQDYAALVDDVLNLLAGTWKSDDGVEVHAVPGEGADVTPWIFGSSGGESAEIAGARGLRFAANYHVAPAGVIDAVDAYRAAFRASSDLAEPYVTVSADVVVAPDEATARELATGYALWVRSIRTAEGAIEFPTPDESRRWTWSEEDRALVQDRLDTQFVGTPAQVADRLEQLQEATGADELALTTITHGHADRVRSYELIAEEWARRAQ
ncbi:LLM class flavin-dependent oxidoreductase [Nocardioides sp. Kera G14]|uniref:LLM class flavin-dependent oxidoreductase n=1 Tax=Nocardioides sp. Kera G14 TaxID=2884264 RepID=UPI001D100EB6|nr:LLM class flavin-dependent oxidoreductase [Nocardioides sp. Kera G14]UDY24393.1 LLM class flavin-dependent oxidoreductase [Nocardioides sp. Kera G14]